MANKSMTRVNFDRTGDGGAIYYEKFSITSGVSDTYILPISSIFAIACRQNNGILSFTFDSIDEIESGDAIFEDWDGSSVINLAATGFKFTWTSSTATAAVTVKTKDE